MGWSAGFTLLNEGGRGMLGGSSPPAFEMADSTSCAAASILRSSVNWMVMDVLPSELDEFIESMPAMVENWRFERGGDGGGHGVRARAGKAGADLNGGIIHAGQRGDGQRAIGDDAEQQNAQGGERGENGAADEELRNVHQEAPLSVRDALTGCTTRRGAPGTRRIWPSVTTVSPGAIRFRPRSGSRPSGPV